MATRIGPRNSERKKPNATTSAVRPVRPPAWTPVTDSMKAVTTDVPRQGPTMLDKASVAKAPVAFGIEPSGRRRLAAPVTPIKVPSVLKNSPQKK